MSRRTDPKGVWWIARHEQSIDEELARLLIAAIRPPDARWSLEEGVETAVRMDYASFGFYLPGGTKAGSPLGLSLKPLPEFEIAPKEAIRLQSLGAKTWFRASSSGSGFTTTADLGGWMVRSLSPIHQVLRPHFGFLATGVLLKKHASEDVERFLWPATLLGPSLVEEIGLARIRKTPAAVVEELEYGGVLIQASERALDASPDDLRAAARHLGLKPA